MEQGTGEQRGTRKRGSASPSCLCCAFAGTTPPQACSARMQPQLWSRRLLQEFTASTAIPMGGAWRHRWEMNPPPPTEKIVKTFRQTFSGNRECPITNFSSNCPKAILPEFSGSRVTNISGDDYSCPVHTQVGSRGSRVLTTFVLLLPGWRLVSGVHRSNSRLHGRLLSGAVPCCCLSLTLSLPTRTQNILSIIETRKNIREPDRHY